MVYRLGLYAVNFHQNFEDEPCYKRLILRRQKSCFAIR